MVICMSGTSVRIDVSTHEELEPLAVELRTTVRNAVTSAVRAFRQDQIGANGAAGAGRRSPLARCRPRAMSSTSGYRTGLRQCSCTRPCWWRPSASSMPGPRSCRACRSPPRFAGSTRSSWPNPTRPTGRAVCPPGSASTCVRSRRGGGAGAAPLDHRRDPRSSVTVPDLWGHVPTSARHARSDPPGPIRPTRRAGAAARRKATGRSRVFVSTSRPVGSSNASARSGTRRSARRRRSSCGPSADVSPNRGGG